MNKTYIVEFDFGNGFGGIPTEIRAENSELALNKAQGMLHSEWVNIVTPDGHPVRMKPDKVIAIRVVDEIVPEA